MLDEHEFRRPWLTAVVAGLGGLVLAPAALTLASPAIAIGLLPDWFVDPAAARVTMRIAGGVVVAVVVLCLVAALRWAAPRLAGRAPAPATVAKALAGSAVVAFWLLCLATPAVADGDPALLARAAPSVFGASASIDNAMMLSGVLALGLPLVAALVAVRLRVRWAVGVLVLLAVVLVVPVASMVRDGANHLQAERRDHRTECVYFVGGYDCPGD
ncbi:hypothetical protein AB0J83_32205 [Actinoplanes sp. NPDC049596]|uniref:hypothetical protein n=1 Tax=unclassified Actinoplanes TaxID=2626549 RepID=UPI003431828A